MCAFTPCGHADQHGLVADRREMLAHLFEHHLLLQRDQRTAVEATELRRETQGEDLGTHRGCPDPASRPLHHQNGEN
ncbi:MAG: hypothetical protein IPK26_07585 [Planctomycetes bacterium]|nr:hypothetical protein [Planctomycetota bacterium]